MNSVTIVLPPYKSFSFFIFSHSVSLCPKGRAIINGESPVLQLCPGACWERWVTETLCRSSDSLLEGDFKCPLLSFSLLPSSPLFSFHFISSPSSPLLPSPPPLSSSLLSSPLIPSPPLSSPSLLRSPLLSSLLLLSPLLPSHALSSSLPLSPPLSSSLPLSPPLLLSPPLSPSLLSSHPLSSLLSSRSSKHRRAYVHLLPLTSGERAGSLSADELVWEREK